MLRDLASRSIYLFMEPFTIKGVKQKRIYNMDKKYSGFY
jgi:hypothetical protein